jgi:molecular chaperone GrpE
MIGHKDNQFKSQAQPRQGQPQGQPTQPQAGQPQAQAQPQAQPKFGHRHQNDQALAKVAELTNDLQRTRADFENYRKQVEIQKKTAENTAKLATVYKMLPLLDDLDRAVKSYAELAPLAKSIEKTMTSLGLEPIKSEPGTEFNPELHEAVMVEESDGDKEVISETLRPGYYYDGAVLRVAMVKVKHV